MLMGWSPQIAKISYHDPGNTVIYSEYEKFVMKCWIEQGVT